MTDWSFPPEIQAQYERVLTQTRKLQAELGIKPRTIEERAKDYEARRAEEQRKAEELKKFNQLIGQKRSIPKWKL